jgi:anti-anti-sigma factor
VEIAETYHGEVVVVAPDGSLGAAADCTKLDRCLAGLIEKRSHRIVVDLARVRTISGAALRTLLVVRRRLVTVGGALVLCGLSEKVLQVFSISGFDRDFTIVPALEEAVRTALGAAGAAAEEPGITTVPTGLPEGHSAVADERTADDDLARLADRLIKAMTGTQRGVSAGPAGALEAPLEALASRARKALGCA